VGWRGTSMDCSHNRPRDAAAAAADAGLRTYMSADPGILTAVHQAEGALHIAHQGYTNLPHHMGVGCAVGRETGRMVAVGAGPGEGRS